MRSLVNMICHWGDCLCEITITLLSWEWTRLCDSRYSFLALRHCLRYIDSSSISPSLLLSSSFHCWCTRRYNTSNTIQGCKHNPTKSNNQEPLKMPNYNIPYHNSSSDPDESSSSEWENFEIQSSSEEQGWSSDETEYEKNGIGGENNEHCLQCGELYPHDYEVCTYCGGPYFEHFCCPSCRRLF